MLKKLVLMAVALTALLAVTTSAFAKTDFCDPPGNPRPFPIHCYYRTSDEPTEDKGTIAQPFKDPNKAIAAAQAHDTYGGYVINLNSNDRQGIFIKAVNSGIAGGSISRTVLFVLLGLVSLILVTAGWFLRRRAGILPRGARDYD